MRNYIFTEHEREVLALYFAGENLTKPDRLAVSKLKNRARKVFCTLKGDFETLKILMADASCERLKNGEG